MKRRSGFTLIELLVVIAIIAILAGLTLGAVMMFYGKGAEITCRNDLLQLKQALDKFKAKHGQYPPPMIRLRANMKDYLPPAQGGNRVDALDDESLMFLRNMWKTLPAVTNIPWAGSTPMPAGGVILEGDQCMMFFLVGPPAVGGDASKGFLGGFSNNPQAPVDPSSMSTPIRYMDPPNAGRLTIRNSALVPNQLFPSYLDGYGTQPYMYFAPLRGRPEGYLTAPNSLGMRPYAKNVAMTQFYLPDSIQLLCAGKDGQFGPGGYWVPGTATGVGDDDTSNFHDKKLGLP
jgi:prepilin-type N-terminal cleavage/methylation domain-containing protein